ncbi:MAG: hypothetical protein WC213_03665 [Arenimonas sp.]|jgi:hypothetical protein
MIAPPTSFAAAALRRTGSNYVACAVADIDLHQRASSAGAKKHPPSNALTSGA